MSNILPCHGGLKDAEYLGLFISRMQRLTCGYPIRKLWPESTVGIRVRKRFLLLPKVGPFLGHGTVSRGMWRSVSIEQDNCSCFWSHFLVGFRQTGLYSLWIVTA